MIRTRTLFAFCFAAFGLVILRPASAATSFDKLPGEQGKTSPLLMRIVQYQGSTNGAITVEVKNPTGAPQEFSAKGIYFVPTGNANEAPQRLGAVGPFQLQSANGHVAADGSDDDCRGRDGAVDAGRLLHRFAPREPQLVDVVPRRQGPRPGAARAAPSTPTRHKSAEGHGGVSAPAAKSAVQSEVWKNRDKKWIELDGEGKQEAAKSHR